MSLVADTKGKSVPGGINMDLPKGACFREFYYRGLYCETSQELEEYIKKNKWYFDRVKPEIQEQFRRIYKDLKRREVMKAYGKKDRCKRDY